MIGLSNGSKQGDKSAQHSKLIRNLAGRIFRKSLAASPLASHGGSATKKVPQAPESCQLPRLHQGIFVWTAWPHRGAFASFPEKLTNAWQLPDRGNEHACNWLSRYSARLRVVPYFSSGIVERAKCEHVWKSPHTRKGNTWRGEKKWRSLIFLSPRRVSPFLAWGDFHARLRFAHSTIPEEK